MAISKHMEIAQTILSQLGGRRFTVMTGAKDMYAFRASSEGDSQGGLQFRLPRGLASRGINCIRISLNTSDTYTVEALKIGSKARGFTVVESREGVYADMLEELISGLTGLATRI